jgi:hypothetical protein
LPRKSYGRRSLVSMGSQRVRHDWATSLHFIYLFTLVALSLHYCTQAFPSCSEWGYSVVAVCGLLITAGFSCYWPWAPGAWASVVEAHGPGSSSSWAIEPRLSSRGARLSCSVMCGIFLHQGSSPVPCMSRQSLNHWITWSQIKSVELISLIVKSWFCLTIFKKWSINLQCCVGFKFPARWFSYIYI